MKKNNVLHVIGSMNLAGAETFLMNILRNINKNKYEIYFLCYGNEKFDYEDEINLHGGHIIRIEKINKKNLIMYIKIIKDIIKQYQINIVHAHTYYNSVFAILAAHQSGIKKIVVHSHTTYSELSPTILKKIYFKISKFLINKYSTDYLACGKKAGEALFYKNKKFEIIDNGIILEDFFYNEKTRKMKKNELGIPTETTIIGHVGRFEEVKNHKFIIEVFKSYLDINPKSILMLIGEGKLKEKIEAEAKKIGIIDKCIFLGKRHDVNELYSVMDLLIFPSLFEGLPVTLIEAQTNGLPILSSTNIDTEVNITNKIVFKSLNDSSEEWAQECNKLIYKRYDCNKLLLNSKYNMKKNISKLEKCYLKQ